jgi:hypothetical protein
MRRYFRSSSFYKTRRTTLAVGFCNSTTPAFVILQLLKQVSSLPQGLVGMAQVSPTQNPDPHVEHNTTVRDDQGARRTGKCHVHPWKPALQQLLCCAISTPVCFNPSQLHRALKLRSVLNSTSWRSGSAERCWYKKMRLLVCPSNILNFIATPES